LAGMDIRVAGRIGQVAVDAISAAAVPPQGTRQGRGSDRQGLDPCAGQHW
jgi:hypothetical protein